MQSKILFLNKYWLEVFLILLSFFYYLYFSNKGIVLYDEGYYFHIADRIIQGQIPYRDFFLQFTPGYFYFLALVLKVFGEQIIVGRFLTLSICMAILFFNFKIGDRLKLIKPYQKILIFLSTVSFGFPLINNPSILAWVSVLSSLVLVYSFMVMIENQKSVKNFIFVGFALALILLIKQNLGMYFLIITNVFLLIMVKNKFKSFFLVNFSFLVPTLIWFFYFLTKSGAASVFEFINFNKVYLSVYPFSYPFLPILSTQYGLFKMVPYYLPVFFLVYLIYFFLKNKNTENSFLPVISLVGFFGTVFPTSDLLHVYPFYSLILISGLIFLKGSNLYRLWVVLTVLSIFIGFYLTFFREYYRYQPKYLLQNTGLNLNRTKGIKIDKPLSSDLARINEFIAIKTSKTDSIFAYPFSPMLYFVFERNNPSRYSIYYPGYLTKKQEEEVIKEIKDKKVKFIITLSRYKFKTELSNFIQKQKLVLETGQFRVFQLD